MKSIIVSSPSNNTVTVFSHSSSKKQEAYKCHVNCEFKPTTSYSGAPQFTSKLQGISLSAISDFITSWVLP